MTPNPTDHELNEMLAKVAGVEIQPFKDSNKEGWAYQYGKDPKWDWRTWNPLHDANQMERVEEGLRENGWTYRVVWYGHTHEARIGADWDDTRFVKCNKDKKRAFTLAVYAMEQEKQKR